MSKNIVLDVENVSKQYRLGEVGTGSLQHDIKRWWANVRGQEDPFLKIGETNDRTQKGDSDYVWALKDINFQVEQGQAVGIIGRNGAGKSTLLKLLSRVTKPTTGSIKYKGRIASLLEVGTGFHPEMTGRENIYLNGAILGMTRKEITRKFDEIVAFAGVERYIDTPVKRYSSGMYVRLAFAVAAHLESEILIVDEVLAVGDAEFQKKCLGKMGDVTKGEGRTVLFVSHNMTAVETLCTIAVSMRQGTIVDVGQPELLIKNYLADSITNCRKIEFDDINKAKGNEHVRIKSASINNLSTLDPAETIDVTSDIEIVFEIVNQTKEEKLSLGFDLKNTRGDVIFGTGNKFNFPIDIPTKISCQIPGNLLNDDTYQILLYIHTEGMSSLYAEDEILSFEIKDIARESGYLGKVNGFIRPQLIWK
ncbi:ABC transporter ATP-binding protein [Empedobacter sp. 225-1]|uniref:ABC transporter ATP-binding protein n=1 Tax=unclassified Empedobacter TaxID=2643773 RepID=UPI0025788424|nr:MULTISPECIES: ABC transporter ATP-binding protein [unclassified Empedobacter]MDM1522417.1 ABC transporter ATP-binding protein [Empedobacter sp. 225-1]MDM1541592.1 ABC transporter ATP-binding protein [Empedobacter sp. 189-2]